MAKKEKEEEFSYDKAMEDVEKIVNALEEYDGQTSFDKLIADVERAKQLIDKCKACVTDAETRLAKMVDRE